MKYEYSIEKHITTEYIVMVTRESEGVKMPIAKCNSQGAALSIKGLYEKAEAEDLNPKTE